MPQLLELSSFKDDRGILTVVEKILPFSIQRVYYLWDTNEIPRGGHKHREGTQALICLQGQCVVQVRDHEDFLLNSPNQCLILESDDWHSLYFNPKAILLVLASHPYSADNYIYD